jgi:hypothetical protein
VPRLVFIAAESIVAGLPLIDRPLIPLSAGHALVNLRYIVGCLFEEIGWITRGLLLTLRYFSLKIPADKLTLFLHLMHAVRELAQGYP